MNKFCETSRNDKKKAHTAGLPAPQSNTLYRGASLIRKAHHPMVTMRPHNPAVGSQGGAVSYERGNPIHSWKTQHLFTGTRVQGLPATLRVIFYLTKCIY
jgi:hypothetical protein